MAGEYIYIYIHEVRLGSSQRASVRIGQRGTISRAPKFLLIRLPSPPAPEIVPRWPTTGYQRRQRGSSQRGSVPVVGPYPPGPPVSGADSSTNRARPLRDPLFKGQPGMRYLKDGDHAEHHAEGAARRPSFYAMFVTLAATPGPPGAILGLL